MLDKLGQLEVEIQQLHSKVAELDRLTKIMWFELRKAQGKPPLWLVGKDAPQSPDLRA